MIKHTVFTTLALVTVAALSGCASEDIELTNATAAAVSTTVDGTTSTTSAAATTSTSSTSSTTNAPATRTSTIPAPAASTAPVTSSKVPAPAIATTPKKTTTTTRSPGGSKTNPASPTAAPTSDGFPNPTPVTPATINPGKTYPWFPVAAGNLAQPYGVTGELLYADSFVTVIRSGPQEIVVAADNYSLRGAWKVIGVTDAKVTVNNGRTLVKLSCNGTELGSTSVRHYNTAAINPASLSVTYDAGMNVSEFDCQNS